MRLKYIELLLAAVLGALPASGISAPISLPCDGGTPPPLPSFTPLPLQTPEPNPLGILRAGPFAYIPNTSANSVAIIDLSASILPLPAIAPLTLDNVGLGPQGVAIDPSGKYIYVSNYAGGTVSVIQAPAHTVVATLPVGNGPASMALHAASGRLYVANQLANTISVIDTATRTVIDTLILSNIPDRLLIHPSGAQLYVLSQALGNLAIIDTQTKAISNVSVLDGVASVAHDMVIDSAGATIYVTLHDTSAASTRAAIVLTSSKTVVFPAIALLGPPKGLAIHPAQSRLYIVTDIYADAPCQITRHADLHVIDIGSRQLVKTLPIPQGVVGINIDNRGWLYGANKKSINRLEILDSAQELVGQSITVGINPSVLGQVVGPELGGILALSSEGEMSFSGTLPGAITERIVTVTNRGVLAFTIQQPNIVTDPLGTDLGFSVGADTCSGQALAPDAQCQITLRFSPKSEGVVSAYFSVASNALTSQAPVPLAALGLPAPAPVVPPPPLPNIGGAGAFDPWVLLVIIAVWGGAAASGRGKFSPK